MQIESIVFFILFLLILTICSFLFKYPKLLKVLIFFISLLGSKLKIEILNSILSVWIGFYALGNLNYTIKTFRARLKLPNSYINFFTHYYGYEL